MTTKEQTTPVGKAGTPRRVTLLLSFAVLSVASFMIGNHLRSQPPEVEMAQTVEPAHDHHEHSAGAATAAAELDVGAAGAGAPQPESDELTGPGIKPAPTYLERDPQEWQGMLVDLSFQPDCTQSSDCGWARACISGKCTACTKDADCGTEESCVLDHCVKRDKAACRSKADCAGQHCMLTGFSTDARNNGEMLAVCADPNSGTEQEPNTARNPEPNLGPAQPPEIEADQLRKELRQH